MGEKVVIRPMGHGRESCRTTHGSWVTKVSYDPWVMGEKIVVRPMGHGPPKCRTTHGSWERKLSYDPWVMGKKSLKGLNPRPAPRKVPAAGGDIVMESDVTPPGSSQSRDRGKGHAEDVGEVLSTRSKSKQKTLGTRAQITTGHIVNTLRA